jgi:hypothetical protein
LSRGSEKKGIYHEESITQLAIVRRLLDWRHTSLGLAAGFIGDENGPSTDANSVGLFDLPNAQLEWTSSPLPICWWGI